MRDSEPNHILSCRQSQSHQIIPTSAGCSTAASAVILKSRPENAVGFVTSALDARHPDIPLVTAPSLPLAATSPTDSRGFPMGSSVELKLVTVVAQDINQ